MSPALYAALGGLHKRPRLMRLRHFTSSPYRNAHSQSQPKRNESKRKAQKWKEIWYHSASVKKNKEGTLGFLWPRGRWDCEAEFTILDAVFAVRTPPLSSCFAAIQSNRTQSQFQFQSHLRSRPRKREAGPLWSYFLTSFMGCHVSNGNENLCVCNWRRGSGSPATFHPAIQSPRSGLPFSRSPWDNRQMSHHFARPQTPDPKPRNTTPRRTSCWCCCWVPPRIYINYSPFVQPWVSWLIISKPIRTQQIWKSMQDEIVLEDEASGVCSIIFTAGHNL